LPCSKSSVHGAYTEFRPWRLHRYPSLAPTQSSVPGAYTESRPWRLHRFPSLVPTQISVPGAYTDFRPWRLHRVPSLAPTQISVPGAYTDFRLWCLHRETLIQGTFQVYLYGKTLNSYKGVCRCESEVSMFTQNNKFQMLTRMLNLT
jgi:hypothetical protein